MFNARYVTSLQIALLKKDREIIFDKNLFDQNCQFSSPRNFKPITALRKNRLSTDLRRLRFLRGDIAGWPRMRRTPMVLQEAADVPRWKWPVIHRLPDLSVPSHYIDSVLPKFYVTCICFALRSFFFFLQFFTTFRRSIIFPRNLLILEMCTSIILAHCNGCTMIMVKWWIICQMRNFKFC